MRDFCLRRYLIVALSKAQPVGAVRASGLLPQCSEPTGRGAWFPVLQVFTGGRQSSGMPLGALLNREICGTSNYLPGERTSGMATGYLDLLQPNTPKTAAAHQP